MKSRIEKIVFRIFEFLASLELAVFLILALAFLLAVGTVYESKYGTVVASREVYRSAWMQGLLWLFMINLAAAAVSRIPWRWHHIGFLITHLGIIILLLGSWITQRAGVDGNLVLAPGESGRTARIDESMMYVFRATAAKAYDLVLSEHLDLDPRRPLKSPRTFRFKDLSGARELKLLSYLPKASREIQAEEVPGGQGMPGLRFQLTGSRATFSDWLFLQADTGATRQVGPAIFRFVRQKPDLSAAPEKATVVLYMDGDKKLPPKIAVARAGQKFQEKGRAAMGKPIALGWMDFQFILEEFHASALPKAEYRSMENAPPMAEGLEVVQVALGDETLWLEMGSAGQVALGDSLYYVQYAKREVDFGFDLKLNDFHIGFYEGSSRPKTYASSVEFAGQRQTISMNEPLHYNGYTFYQASYESDADGKPKYSVLSVNLDPGRRTKYLGSLMTVLGIISMFYFKPVYSGRNKWLLKKQEGNA